MKPLLICDCDEVLMGFAAPFSEHLRDEHGMTLTLSSFALAGNIRRHGTGELVPEAEFPGLLSGFFRSGMHRQRPVPGVEPALSRLSALYDVVILTNIEDEFRNARREQLRRHGMDYEVYCNRGPKGPALLRLLDAHDMPPAVFIDDLPPHHDSVAKTAPDVHRVHMVADKQLRDLIPKAEAAHVRIDSWADAEPYLQDLANSGRLA
ncbi:hypothetical protein [Pacificimonas flava]|uniref:HAD family hydrolase n=1 Tax=Pacificimonas flava TaxID=1234595 RepID=M2U3K8_9SPHN|nr:hypothetical protein [Pacificimonas flava]EMD82533.1 hypothetical protein C725_2254 [Pacificimonas flava]MBB5281363.1 hypothetical protein [Pacificimonas flava]